MNETIIINGKSCTKLYDNTHTAFDLIFPLIVGFMLNKVVRDLIRRFKRK